MSKMQFKYYLVDACVTASYLVSLTVQAKMVIEAFPITREEIYPYRVGQIPLRMAATLFCSSIDYIHDKIESILKCGIAKDSF